MVKTSLQSVSELILLGGEGRGRQGDRKEEEDRKKEEDRKRGRGREEGEEREGERGGRRGKRDGEVRIIKSCCIYLAFNSSNSYQSMSNSRDF